MNAKKYTHVFFDLDHTLWDFDKNSSETLFELYHDFELKTLGIEDVQKWIDTYHHFNYHYWHLFHQGKINHEELRTLRFKDTFDLFQVDSTLVDQGFHQEYVLRCPQKKHLIPGALELLEHLHGHYSLHIISNGFLEVQKIKLESAGIAPYFQEIITSERSGARKPEKAMFDFALQLVGAQAHESIMIGDDALADIRGAAQHGLDQIYLKHAQSLEEEATFVVKELKEIHRILKGNHTY